MMKDFNDGLITGATLGFILGFFIGVIRFIGGK
jgi:hypothetical protein